MHPSVTVNLGLRYDLQYLESIATDRNNVSPRVGIAWSPFASRRTVVRASGGRFYDRVPLRALANAILSAGNTTDIANLRQIGISLSPTQTGAPIFPNILSAIVPTTTLVNLTTLDPNLRNAYSNQGSIELEQQVGVNGTVSVSYQHLRGEKRVSYAYSTSMNNLGEAFFSSPIDPFDLAKDWARSDDDQRHRFVLSGAVGTGAGLGAPGWKALTRDFQLSGMVQYYSALPFNITTGTNTIQGTGARPTVNGAFISRNAGEGSAFSTTSLRVSRILAAGSRVKVEALVEVFNLFNRRNDLARTTVFGTGAYPTSPSATFGQVTVVGEPRSAQISIRVRY